MAHTDKIDTRPTCPICGKGKLTQLVAFIVCAWCQKMWLPHEFEAERDSRG